MSVRLEILLSQLGCPGRFQILIVILVQIQFVMYAAYLSSSSFWLVAPPLICQKPLEQQQSTEDLHNSTNGLSDLCSHEPEHFDDHNSTSNATFVKCQPLIHGFPLNGTVEFTSVAMEFGYLCDNQYPVRIVQTLFFCGTMVGGMICGPLADRFGRKPVGFAAVYMAAILGFIVVFIKNFYLFAVLKILQGALLQGFNSVTNCIKTEIFHGQYRAFVNVLSEAIGISLQAFYVAAAVYFTGHWRYVELAICLPLMFTIVNIWVVPESLRWLLKNRRQVQAITVINRFARFNGIPAPINVAKEVDSIISEIDVEGERQTGCDVRDLFRPRRMAMYTCIFAFTWFTWLFVTYGFMFSLANLSGNLIVNFVIMGFLDLVFRSSALLILKKYEKKNIACYALCCSGFFLMAMVILRSSADTSIPMVATSSTVLAFLGRGAFALFSVTNTVLLAEVFPTLLRATANGFFFACGRVGSLLSPQVVALGDYTWKEFPFFIFGVVVIISGLLNLMLPGTLNKPMPNAIEDTLVLHKKTSDSPKLLSQPY